MISFQVSLADTEILAKLGGLPEKVQLALRAKMEEEVEILRDKVAENLSGGVLNLKTGALLSALVSGTEELGDLLVGYVGIESEDENVKQYAVAHEYGGKSYYPITPIHKTLLVFFWERMGKVVFLKGVNHPPQKERSYLRSALYELRPEIEEGLKTAVESTF